jgi:hypothetical protein
VTIRLAEEEEVAVELVSLTGQLVRTILPNQQLIAGEHQFLIDRLLLETRMYILIVRIGSNIQTKKLSLIR